MSENATAAPLPVGTVVEGCEIERVIDQGAFSVRYLVRDAGRSLLLREFLPQGYVVREGQALVAREPEDRNALRWWMRSFLEQAQTLSQIRHPALPLVLRTFEANNTAYGVSEPVAGETLEAVLQRDGVMEEARLRRLLRPLLGGLEKVHAAGLIHRDISPRNIVIRTDGNATLVDFAVLRTAVRFKSGLLASTATGPFSAPEETSATAADIGPWSDLYSLGGVCYQALCGTPPVAASQRRAGSPLLPAAQASRVTASPALLRLVDGALTLEAAARPQSVADWQAALQDQSQAQPAALAARPSRRSGGIGWVIAALLLLLVGAGGYWWTTQKPAAAQVGTVPVAASASDSGSATAQPATAAEPPPASAARTPPEGSSLDQLALQLMARDKKAQDQQLEELQARLAQREAAKAAAATAAAKSLEKATPEPAAKAAPRAAAPASPAEAPAATAASDAQDEALRNEVARLRSELAARKVGVDSPKSAPISAGYQSAINAAIASRLKYPRDSLANQEEGNDTVRVRVQRNGQILSASVVQRSGFPRLDTEAVNVFNRIGRFPPVPADFEPGAPTVEFVLPIRFKLADN